MNIASRQNSKYSYSIESRPLWSSFPCQSNTHWEWHPIVRLKMIPCCCEQQYKKARIFFGVTDGIRTHDDWNHNPGLYQLSYGHRRNQKSLLLIKDIL